jgi:putative FmdB family regulatory protein
MPNYDYECETCGKRFEFFQSMKDEKLTTCPAKICEKQGKVRRLLGKGGGIIFKGGGFYQTDYRSESYQSGAKKESDSAKPTPAPASESKASTPSTATSSE